MLVNHRKELSKIDPVNTLNKETFYDGMTKLHKALQINKQQFDFLNQKGCTAKFHRNISN